MSYYFSKTVGYNFEAVVERISTELKKVGFGILTEIDVKATLKKKIDVDFRNYKILGACNPNFAHKALSEEEQIGILLPCNVVVQEFEDRGVEVSVMNPTEAMSIVGKENLHGISSEVAELLQTALNNI